MMLSLAYLIIFGMLGNVLFKTFKLPGLIGMLLAGMVIGPQGLNLLDGTMLAISEDLRKIALIIILLRAGLGLNRRVLMRIGKKATALSIIPVLFEGFFVLLLMMWLFDFHFVQAGMAGFILAAVSPAVIVPAMLKLMKNKVGVKKNIPTLVLSAASVDDVIAITLFSTFLSIYFSQTVNVLGHILGIPISIGLGILLGVLIGVVLVYLFNRYHMRDSNKVVLLIAIGIFMVSFSAMIEAYILIASLLGVMALGLVITERKKSLGERLSIKFDKVWVLAELFLFVLVGAVVDIQVALQAGLLGLVVIAGGLLARSLGVVLATCRTDFSWPEKSFLMIAFMPKATVQAAVGSIPLSLDVAGGEIILALAVLSILVTAPLGAIGIQLFSRTLLHKSTEPHSQE